MSELQAIESEILTLESERNALLEELKPLQDKITENYRKLQDAVEQKDKILISQMGDEPDWEFILFEDGRCSMARHHLADKKLQKLLMMPSIGYCPDTNQRMLRIGLTHNDKQKTEKIQKGIETILPYIKTRKDGNKVISIFEQSCSQHGSYYLTYDPSKDGVDPWAITRNTHTISTYGTLAEALAYIQQHLYYEGPSRDDDY